MGAEGITYKDYQYIASCTGRDRSQPFVQQTSWLVIARRNVTNANAQWTST
jgi:hypothetical protein